MKAANGKLIAIVRIRGKVNLNYNIEETMQRLNLKAVNNCSLVKLTDSYKGMINKCQNHVAYGEIDEPTLAKLLARHVPGANAKEVIGGKLDSVKESMPLRLHPPRRGYRAIKQSFNQGGQAGYMGSDINKLIGRMI